MFDKLNNFDLGYGIYFGQRQFRACLKEKPILYDFEIINNLNEFVKLDSITNSNNLINTAENSDFISIDMLTNYKIVKNGREPLKMENILYSKTDKLIGQFEQIIKLKNVEKNIYFYTMINE